MLGMGMDIEVWGLKKSVLECPELVDYIDQVVKIISETAGCIVQCQGVKEL